MEHVMRERAWSRKTVVFAAVAAMLAAATPHLVAAGVNPIDRPVAGAGQMTAFGAAGKIEANPTDNGSIIIECVVLGEHPITVGLSGIAGMRLGSVPRQPLGPSKCWVQDKLLS
jgi:spore coat protein U-like protein